MKIKKGWAKYIFGIVFFLCIVLSLVKPTQAKVVDTNPVTDQRWIISEIYLGKNNYDGAYIELYNNDDTTALGWKDFLINLPFNIDLPPIFDLQVYKPHTYKKLPLDEGWTGWLAKMYLKVMYGDDIFYEIEDALDEQENYSYQRCQTTYDDGTRVLSNKFYYGKKTPGDPIPCDDKTVTMSNPDDLPKAGTCQKLRLNEIGSYLEPEEQFIELINTGNDIINLSNCYVAKSKATSAIHHQLEDYELEPGELYSFNVDQTDLESITKTSGIIYLIDSDDETVVNYKRYSSIKENAGMAVDQNSKWKMTYKLTPGEDNIIEEYPPCPEGQYRDEKTHRCRDIPDEKDDNTDSNIDNPNYKPCPEGYERNPETNRCRKIVDDKLDENGLKPCPTGYERNPETNRCRKIIDDSDDGLAPCREGYVRNPETNRCVKIKTAENELTPCKEGYVRNPETNRCIKIKTEPELTPCKEGYERNPETNRCVKIKSTSITDTDKDADAKYPIIATTNGDNQSTSTTSLIIVMATITAISVLILLIQYRREISNWWIKVTEKPKTTPDTPSANETSEWLDKLTKD